MVEWAAEAQRHREFDDLRNGILKTAMGLAKEAQACAVPPYFPAACRVRRRIPRAHPGGMPAISRGLRRFAPIPPDCRRNQFDPGRGRRPCVRPRDPHGSLRVVCGCWRKCVARLPALAPHPGCDWFLPDSRGYCFAQPPANGWKPSGFPWSLAIFCSVRTERERAAMSLKRPLGVRQFQSSQDGIERLLKKLPEKTRRRPLEKLRSCRRRQSRRG